MRRQSREAGTLARSAKPVCTSTGVVGDPTHLKVGSVDFVIWSGNPLSQFTRAEQTWIDGRRYFSIEEDRARRERVQTERQQLIQAVLAADNGDENDRPRGGRRRGR